MQISFVFGPNFKGAKSSEGGKLPEGALWRKASGKNIIIHGLTEAACKLKAKYKMIKSLDRAKY